METEWGDCCQCGSDKALETSRKARSSLGWENTWPFPNTCCTYLVGSDLASTQESRAGHSRRHWDLDTQTVLQDIPDSKVTGFDRQEKRKKE
jgi:hypothetical protein